MHPIVVSLIDTKNKISAITIFPFALLQKIELVDDNQLISKEKVDNYLIHKFVPYVTSFYEVSAKVITNVEVLSLMLQTIKILGMHKSEVCRLHEL